MSSFRGNETSRNYQSDVKLFNKETSSQHGSTGLKQRLKFCFKFFAFIFSHIGLGFLVLAYTIFGAFLFKHFEEPSVLQRNNLIANLRNTTVDRLWIETYKLNVLYKENWTAMAIKEIDHFQRVLIDAFKDGYRPVVTDNAIYSRWSFIDSWMYSISIITTIGYANRPLTTEGKITTMLYALIGIPIMLLFLSTIGSLLGRGLKILYNFCCICSSDHSHTFINLESSQDHLHHLHDNYQVHHIAMNHISNVDGPNNLMVAHCNQTQQHKNYTALNSMPTNSVNPHPYPLASHTLDDHAHTAGSTAGRACSCQMENESKLTTESILDHIRTSSYNTEMVHQHAHNCTCSNIVETDPSSAYFKDPDLGKIHPPSSSVFEENIRENVPFYFCFFLITLYIIIGSIMFHVWEGLSFLDGAYFCFVTLSTIGFGDILPEKTLSASQTESKKRIIIIVIYILGGMTLVAMSFNIIYEQLVFKFKKIGYQYQSHDKSLDTGNTMTADVGSNKDLKIMNNNHKFFHSNEDIDV